MQFEAVTFNDDAKKRIADAAIFEKRLRTESVIGVDQEFFGLKFRQITVRDILNLEFTENRLTMGKKPELDDLLSFALMLSNDQVFFKNRYARKVGKIIHENELFRTYLICYYNSSFNDMPAIATANNITNEEKIDSSVSIITLVDSIASNYGWNLCDILDMPISTSLQLLQRILNRNSESYSIRNEITQQAKADELKKIRENG